LHSTNFVKISTLESHPHPLQPLLESHLEDSNKISSYVEPIKISSSLCLFL